LWDVVEPPPRNREHLSKYVVRIGTVAAAPDVAGNIGEHGGVKLPETSGPVSGRVRHAPSSVECSCPSWSAARLIRQVGAVDMSAYCASKAGVFGLTKSLARELAPDRILVNCIAPGPVDTALLNPLDRTPELMAKIPLGRIGRPDEIAFAVLFLASPQTSWTTGQILSPNGGVVMQ
jgi:NAD(P)-dependent dehydrogenase (short-subunit alcohol dehydrogenase family)